MCLQACNRTHCNDRGLRHDAQFGNGTSVEITILRAPRQLVEARVTLVLKVCRRLVLWLVLFRVQKIGQTV